MLQGKEGERKKQELRLMRTLKTSPARQNASNYERVLENTLSETSRTAGDAAQLLECLLKVHKTLGSSPRTTKELAMVTRTSNSSPQKVEARR